MIGRPLEIRAAKSNTSLDVLNMFFFFFFLAPPPPPGALGEGPDCHFPVEIVGFGPIPARIRGFLIFILALSTAGLVVGRPFEIRAAP